MKILQSKTEQKQTKDEDLEQQYKELQQFWDSCKQSKTHYTKRRCLSDTTNLYQLSISPRNLMSSLQTEPPSEDETECIRNNRRAAIDRSKFRGRRLFEEDDEMGFGEIEEICSNMSNNDGEIVNCGITNEVGAVENCKKASSSSSSCDLSSEKFERENVEIKEEKKDFKRKKKGFLCWFLFIVGVIVFFLGMFFVSKSFGCEDHDEMILVPT